VTEYESAVVNIFVLNLVIFYYISIVKCLLSKITFALKDAASHRPDLVIVLVTRDNLDLFNRSSARNWS
jgi:hypothetical protein